MTDSDYAAKYRTHPGDPIGAGRGGGGKKKELEAELAAAKAELAAAKVKISWQRGAITELLTAIYQTARVAENMGFDEHSLRETLRDEVK